MNTAQELVSEAIGNRTHDNVPETVRAIIDRHRHNLLDLADALLVAGRDEEEVVEVIKKASESFSIKLRAETGEISS